MRLPLQWNGRFLHQVNGGNDGEVVPAIGDPKSLNAYGGKSTLARRDSAPSTKRKAIPLDKFRTSLNGVSMRYMNRLKRRENKPGPVERIRTRAVRPTKH